MEKIKIIFTDTILLFLSCIVEIFSYFKGIFKSNNKITLNKNTTIVPIPEKINNYPGTGYTCGSINTSNSELDKNAILKARLSKFENNSSSQNFEKQKNIRQIINNKYKKEKLLEQKYILSDKKNEQILRDWIN
ncbi:hypothetical protein ma602 [Moumouvirus australiensis]|uniref:Uncharacterized protein n=1 Tax=Moumouvirus australiensis TaxID=2109587 RepID=A0A2P1EMA8_9VIRU|nr:hypothetical protein QKC55_gp303 [Moumouvirus australiensis]AVL94988.1 hypothetical protein ma602 [Moumouvirus australiensis]